jgi:hypothetical protein
MKMATTQEHDDDMLPEYDLSQLKGGVRGKFYAQYQAGSPMVVRLDPDVALAFPTEASVNQALRRLAQERQSETV